MHYHITLHISPDEVKVVKKAFPDSEKLIGLKLDFENCEATKTNEEDDRTIARLLAKVLVTIINHRPVN